MDEFIEIFVEHLTSDSAFISDIIDRFSNDVKSLGAYIKHKDKSSICCHTATARGQELMDFLDGNGFKVEYEDDLTHAWLTIIYEDEKYEEEEKEDPIIDLWASVSNTTLYYTSVEAGTRYILELPQFFPPRPLRFRIHGCLGFLYLVSKSGSRSTPLPRPP